LQVTDFAGCIGYDTVFIKVYNGPTYYVPNAFSPNGDGLNDVFRAVPSGIVRTEYFRIFNRYGNLVFDTREYLKGWDGSFLGKKQPLGTYVWMVKGVDRDGKTVEMKGTVMLVQ
jgi:gliding motility-associated-like protein